MPPDALSTGRIASRVTITRQLAPVAVAATALLILAAIVHVTGGHISHLLRDPSEVPSGHPLAGILSHLGVGLWLATSVVAAVGAVRHVGRSRRFLACAAALSLLLGLDDGLLLHERWFPFVLGIPETVVIATYVVLTAGIVWHFRDVIRARPHAMLVAAIVLFSISVGLDLVEALAPADVIHPFMVDRFTDLYILIEDGAKLLGIVAWLFYFERVAGGRPGIERSRTA